MTNKQIKIKNGLRFIFLIIAINLMTYSFCMIATSKESIWQIIHYWIMVILSECFILNSFSTYRHHNRKMIVFGDIWNVDEEVRDDR